MYDIWVTSCVRASKNYKKKKYINAKLVCLVLQGMGQPICDVLHVEKRQRQSTYPNIVLIRAAPPIEYGKKKISVGLHVEYLPTYYYIASYYIIRHVGGLLYGFEKLTSCCTYVRCSGATGIFQ